jgi:hypothetical protein
MHKDWRDDLVQRYAEFFAPSGYPMVDEGWRDLLERALRRVASAIGRQPAGAHLQIVQIKEKFGTIRIYYHAEKLSTRADQAVREAIDLAEARSACTCEICGDEGRLYNNSGWYSTRCGRHADGDAVALRPGWKNLRIVQTVDRGGLRVASCRRYDRDRDTLVDAPLPIDWNED